MRRLFERSLFSFGKKPLTIIWMDKINSRVGLNLLEADTEILKGYLIGVGQACIGPKDIDVLWRKVENLSKFCFLFADFLFRRLRSSMSMLDPNHFTMFPRSS
jgi:hypothetical protein